MPETFKYGQINEIETDMRQINKHGTCLRKYSSEKQKARSIDLKLNL